MSEAVGVERRASAVRWRIVCWTGVAGLVAYALRYNMSIAAPAMMHDLGLSETQLGLILGAFAWTYGLFQLPGGLVGNRFGPRRTMFVLFIGWFATTALMASVPADLPVFASVGLLVLFRVAQGAVQAPVFPVTLGGSLFAWLPPRQWALGTSISGAGATVGAAVAGPVVTWLVLATGWRQSFLLVAPIGLLLAALWWYDYRDDPATHPGVNREESALILGGRPAAHEGAAVAWSRLLGDRQLLLLTASYLGSGYVFYLFFSWFPYYLTEIRGVPATTAGYFLAAQWTLGAVAALAGGMVCDRLSTRFGASFGCRVSAVGGLVLSAPLLVAGTLVSSPVWNVVLLSASFGCVMFSDAPHWAAAMRMAGSQSQGATGLLNTGANVAGGIGAMLVPVMAASFGWTVAVGSGAVCVVVAALCWVGIRADESIRSRVPSLTVPALGINEAVAVS
jgi:MFS transporter, ACS family, glucarate transporter